MEGARGYSHHGTGIAALLAALADEEGAVWFAQQKVLSLRAV